MGDVFIIFLLSNVSYHRKYKYIINKLKVVKGGRKGSGNKFKYKRYY